MQARKLSLIPLLLVILCLTSCGGSSKSKSYTAINGNWHVAGEPNFAQATAGEPNFAQAPYMVLTMGVDGNTIYASGEAEATCSNKDGKIGLGLRTNMSAQIASDGSFVMTSGTNPIDSALLTVRGTIPADGSKTWSGSYSFASGSQQSYCTFNFAKAFVATEIQPLDGTYAGTMNVSGSGTDIQVVTQITQDPFVGVAHNLTGGYTPLSATITVTGFPCFTTGTTANPTRITPSSIDGYQFALNYTMNDGSSLNLEGVFADSSGSILQLQGIGVIGGKCAGTFGGTLTRQ